MRRVLISGLLMCLAGCGSSSSSSSNSSCNSSNATATSSVKLTGFAFVPACVSVAKGTTITFTNSDPVAHTVTTDSGQVETFDSLDLPAAQTYTHDFATAGTIAIHCNYHSDMHLSVVVN